MRIYRGDLRPDLEITCTDKIYNPATGRHDIDQPIDLSSASSIKVVGRIDDTVVLTRAIAGPYSTTGVVTMPWQAGDTDTPGTLRVEVEVEVTWPGSKPQTFRPDDYVTIAPDLG